MPSRLAAQTSARLAAAGFTRGDPALERIRGWNAALPTGECGWPACGWHGDAPYTP